MLAKAKRRNMATSNRFLLNFKKEQLNRTCNPVYDKLQPDCPMTDQCLFYRHIKNEHTLRVGFYKSELARLGVEVEKNLEASDLSTLIHPDDVDLFAPGGPHKILNRAFNCRILLPADRVVIVNATCRLDDEVNLSRAAKVYSLQDVHAIARIECSENIAMHNFQAMLRLSNDFIYFKDTYHVLTAASDTLAKLTGFERGAELVGKTDYDLFPRDNADEYYRLEKAIYCGDLEYIEEVQEFIDKDGETGWVNNRKYPIQNERGELVGLFGIARIVTKEIQTRERLDKALKELQKSANTDSLTKLTNRRYGMELFEKAASLAERYRQELSLIMFDIDYFKRFNDEFGHQCGDRVLCQLADRVQTVLRKSDVMFRYGGEEFVILMPKTSVQEARGLTERIRSTLKNLVVEGTSRSLTVSAGVIEKRAKEGVDEMIGRVDALLYKAKHQGRDRFLFDVDQDR